MKILHVNDHLAPRGGVETYLLSVIPALESHGIEQGVLFGNGDPGLVRFARRLEVLSEPGWSARSEVERAVNRVLSEYQPDVVHLHSIYNADAIEYLLDHVPVVVTAHDFRYLCPASNFYFRRTEEICDRTCAVSCFATTARKKCMTLRPRYSWKYYQRVRRVAKRFRDFGCLIAPSASTAARFTERGFPRERVRVLPYFCRIPPKERPRPLPEQHQILYLGRLSQNKGWRYFVEALGCLPKSVRGMIVGNMSSASEEQLQKLAAAHACAGRLHWSSWASEQQVSEYLAQSSVLVFPSLWPETLGIVGLEAMANGVPVVASNVGGVTEWLDDGKTGVLVPPKDARALADAVMRIVMNPDLASQMGREGLRRVRQHYSQTSHVGELREIYSRVMGLSPGTVA